MLFESFPLLPIYDHAWARPSANVLPEGFSCPEPVRLHVVRQHSNPLLWRLLNASASSSGPFLVNTSFNLFGEPLVVSPRDAVRSYFCSGIDALMIENFVLSKAAVTHVVPLLVRPNRSSHPLISAL